MICMVYTYFIVIIHVSPKYEHALSIDTFDSYFQGIYIYISMVCSTYNIYNHSYIISIDHDDDDEYINHTINIFTDILFSYH